MHQDSLRSAVYRSFVTCNDPKGIVDCKTLRKSRTGSQKMDRKIESRRTPRNSNTSMAYKAETGEMLSKGLTEDVHSLSSFQLMEVSGGAQKLNQMIDSWSKGVRFDGQSKDIAKDLLKGALDLQESLIMLGKLQKASDYMAQFKKKNVKSERRRIDEVGIERTYSSQFGDQNTSMPYKAEKEEMLLKGLTEKVHSPSSFQLMEVSRGAQKLNQMIDSWSKGVRFDGKSKDIAQDLFKGALELQESLIMLGKLQEASDYMAQFKKKQNEKSERRRIDEVGIERTYSSQVGDQKFSMGFQKPLLSVDGSSRNHIEELKKVIIDSFARQNLLPNPISEEMDFLHRRDSDSASEIPSTSSNKSLMVHASDFGSTDSSLSSTDPQKKTKGPNLIAKLMGLEQLPSSKSIQATLQKRLESERISNQRRPIFDIDMPKGRKPLSTVQNVDPELRTLKKILETMQFKGLLKSNSAKELKPRSYHSSDFHSKQSLINEIPPIVLIKPMRVPCQLEELHTPVLQEDESLNTKAILTKLKVKGELPSKTHKEGALSSKKIRSKMEVAETPIKMLSLEEGAKEHKEVVGKTEEKEVKSEEKTSNKLKASGSVDHKRQKKEAIDKKAGKIQKVAAASRKLLGMENVKAKIVPRSEDHAKVTSIKLKRPHKGSNLINNQIPRQPCTTQNTIPRHTTKTIISNSSDQKKNRMKQTTKTKPVREPIAAKSVIESFGSKEDDKRINLRSENCSTLMRTDTALEDQLPIEEKKDASESHIGEHCSNSRSSLSDVTPLSPKHEMDDKTAEEDIFHSRTDIKSFETGSNLRALLLSSPSFLTRAEELFDLNESSSTILRTSGIDDLIAANGRLSLECANELIERKILRVSQTVHPLLLTHVGNLRVCISIDKLVEEVCYGVENLRSYSKLSGGSLPVDSIYAMLERDTSCNGLENGIWELGWRHGFSVDDAEQVVNEIEKLVFNGLIEELLT